MMDAFLDYDTIYPELVLDIMEYFRIRGDINSRSVGRFCEENSTLDKNGHKLLKYNPTIIDKICRKLCDKNIMIPFRSVGGTGVNNNYGFIIRNENKWHSERNRLLIYYNSVIYGFEYIYRLYRDIVVPLVWEQINGDYSVGTGFKLYGGIVTARHCIEDPASLAVSGYTADELADSKIYVSENPDLDVAFIDIGRKNDIPVYTDEGKVLQEVLVMGYPKIPAFTDFLTAEKATISAKASSRLTPTKGSIAAYGMNYLARTELMLITAKIRGGNSGGPVINEEGSIVGIACQKPYYADDIGNYDDLGYGIAVPIEYLNEIVRKKSQTITVSKGFFRNFDGA